MAQERQGIYLISIIGASLKKLRDDTHGAALSPDGSTLAFVRWINFGVADVYVAPASGGPARRITHDNLKVHGLAWGDDARHVLG